MKNVNIILKKDKQKNAEMGDERITATRKRTKKAFFINSEGESFYIIVI